MCCSTLCFCTPQLVTGTVALYNALRTDLLPTPSKSHYTFNLRDLSKVVQGLMRAAPSVVTLPGHALSLWLHESSRVFGDRLTCDEDRALLKEYQEHVLRDNFNTNPAVVTGGAEHLVYADFMVPGAEPRVRMTCCTRYTSFASQERKSVCVCVCSCPVRYASQLSDTCEFAAAPKTNADVSRANMHICWLP
jgi:AAA+ lid domain